MPSSDPNLMAALRLSAEQTEATDTGFSSDGSPLSEAIPDALDELMDSINQNLAAGLPTPVSDDDLRRLIDIYRARAYTWTQQEQTKKPRRRTKAEQADAIGEALDI
jgi:hypothetical protein